jgi:hypothetical protein
VLDTRVLSLGVLTDEDGVDVVVRRLETLDGDARADVGEKGEGSSEGEVERDVALADCAGSVRSLGMLSERSGEQRSIVTLEQRRRGAVEQRSREAEERRSRGAEEQRGRGSEDQRRRGAEEPKSIERDRLVNLESHTHWE